MSAIQSCQAAKSILNVNYRGWVGFYGLTKEVGFERQSWTHSMVEERRVCGENEIRSIPNAKESLEVRDEVVFSMECLLS